MWILAVGALIWYWWTYILNADTFSPTGAVSNNTSLGNAASNTSTSVSTVPDNALTRWAQAITDFEHWAPGSRSYRNNNPGNLKFFNQPGAIGADAQGFAIFGDVQAGWHALLSDLKAKIAKYPDYSILQIMTRYLGGNVLNPQVTSEGNPFSYAQAVANKIGVSVNDTLSNVFRGVS